MERDHGLNGWNSRQFWCDTVIYSASLKIYQVVDQILFKIENMNYFYFAILFLGHFTVLTLNTITSNHSQAEIERQSHVP